MLNLFKIPSMKERSYEPELMDNPDADPEKLMNTLKQFVVINYLFSRSRKLIKEHQIALMTDRSRTYSYIDIAAGGCDTAKWLAKVCRRKGIKIKITCLDYDTTIVKYAKTVTANFPEISVIHGSAFELETFGQFDFIFTSHFLHHLTYDQIRMMIPKIQASCNISFVLNDLCRSPYGYFGFALFTGIFIPRGFTRPDGLLSVRRSFLAEEFHSEVTSQIPMGSELDVFTLHPARICITNKRKPH